MNYPEPTVGAVIFNPDNKVLLCKTHKWNGKYTIPGGHIELGETMEEALVREIKEETGLDIYDIRLASLKEAVYTPLFHEKKHFIFIDFVCRTNSSDVVLNDEAEEYIWADLSEIDTLDLGGFVKPLLEELQRSEQSKYHVGILYGF